MEDGDMGEDGEMKKPDECVDMEQHEDGVQAKRRVAMEDGDKSEEDGDTSGKSVDPLTLKVTGNADEEVDESAGESSTDLGEDVKEDSPNEDLIGRGTTKTLMSPETEKQVDTSSELIQLSGHRRNLLARFKRHAMEDPEDRLDKGTTDTKASPATKGISDTENLFQTEELDAETQGQSATPAPPILSGHQLLARAFLLEKAARKKLLIRANAEIRRLRESNERYYRRYAEVAKAWKWDQCVRLAMDMLDKGQFRIDEKTNKQRGVKEQRQAAYDEARAFLRESNEDIERIAKVISRIQPASPNPPQWTHDVRRPHPDAIKRAHAAPAGRHQVQASNDASELFVDDPARGF